jgi:hypothetical protein
MNYPIDLNYSRSLSYVGSNCQLDADDSVNTGMYMNSRRVVYVALGEIQIAAVDAGSLIEFRTTVESKYVTKKNEGRDKRPLNAPVILTSFIYIRRQLSEKDA